MDFIDFPKDFVDVPMDFIDFIMDFTDVLKPFIDFHTDDRFLDGFHRFKNFIDILIKLTYLLKDCIASLRISLTCVGINNFS